MKVTPRVNLIAPCGMDCGVCSAYLAYSHHIPRKRGLITHCSGCRTRQKKCAYLKGHCARLAKGKVEYCFQCGVYPCERLKHLDWRYQTTYGMSFLANLDLIRKEGPEALVVLQHARFGCARCGELRSVHNQRCFVCDKIESWRA